MAHMTQKAVIKIPGMTDAKRKKKAMEAAAAFEGIDLITADLNEQIMTIIGRLNILAIGNTLHKMHEKIGGAEILSLRAAAKEEIVSVRPAKEKKEETKGKKNEKKKEEPKNEEKK